MNFRYKINLYHRFFYWNKEKIVFVHVPKAAGTSINKALYGRTLGHYTALQIKSAFPNLYENAFVFSLGRNPWSQVLSAYRFAKQGATDSMGISNPSYYQRYEFRSFESFLFEWLVFQDLKEIDFVFRPQYSFLCGDGNYDVIVDYVGKVENIVEAASKIKEFTGRSIKLNRENVTRGKVEYQKHYKDNDSVNVIRDIYANDIEIFGYSFDE